MINIIYAEWLKIAPFIYLVLGIISLCSITPPSEIYKNYRLGKNIFSILLFFMGAYIAALGLFDFRTNDPILAKSINISSFFAAGNVTLYMFEVLLGRGSALKVALRRIGAKWLTISLLLLANYLFVPHSVQAYVTTFFSLILIVEVVRLAINFFKIYRRVQDKADDYYSDSVQPFIKWMKTSLYALLTIGFIGCMHAYFPPLVNTIYGALAIVVLTYIVVVFRNYLMTISHIFHAFDQDDSEAQTAPAQESAPYVAPTLSEGNSSEILHNAVKGWIESKGFAQAGVTAEDLAESFHSNRTYLTTYIRSRYDLSFREWIASLRVAYAKELLLNKPDLSISEVAEAVGYNRTSFVKIFSRECGMTPVQWRESGGAQ